MAAGLPTAVLTQQEFTPADHKAAERVARFLGYTQYAYTSTSALWGLFCMRENPAHAYAGDLTPLVPGGRPTNRQQSACIIKTRELGFLVVTNLEDLGLRPDGRRGR